MRSFSNLWSSLLLIAFSHSLVIDDPNISKAEKKEGNDQQQLASKLSSLIINGVDSPPRLFYARLLYRREFCGATVLNERFVLTAGHCANKLRHLVDVITVEVGDYTRRDLPKKQYSVEKVFLNPLYGERNNVPMNDVALVKTRKVIENGNEIALRLCNWDEILTDELTPHQIIGFCGMGSFITEATHSAIPGKLKQMIFKRTFLQNPDPRYLSPCPEEVICVNPVFEKGNICMMDDGGPLYKFACGTMIPECLLGVASYSLGRSDTPMQVCNNGSFFTHVPLFGDWIDYIMNHYINIENKTD
ncbi:myeloblastin-like [Convolutriloba macropyga]|uniref:myeloblastin-like n=1 Tax=Convolutriloba macropyga TaxID=536237 RepID=UPI003F51DEEF